MPKLTILIPTYNCARFIEECINSLRIQCFNDYEILVIDDGSTDDTEAVVSAIRDERIVYIKNKRNLGIVSSLNKGLELAKGKFIARMDADDVIIGNRLKIQVDFLEKNSDYGMVGSWYKVMNERGNILFEVMPSSDPLFLRLGLVFTNQFAHPAVMMRTDMAKKLKYDKKFKHCEDHELWIRIAEISKTTNLPFFFLTVRSHARSTCSLNQSELKLNVINLLSRELNKLEINHSTEELMLQAAVCFGLSKKLFKNRKSETALLAWYDKIFASPVLNKRYSKAWLLTFKNYMLSNYCGINSQATKS